MKVVMERWRREESPGSAVNHEVVWVGFFFEFEAAGGGRSDEDGGGC